MHVLVAVLGDLGRSPRMQYHAVSLLNAGHDVTLVGYAGEDLVPALQKQDRLLTVVRLHVPTPRFLQEHVLLLPLYYLWRILSLTIACIYAFAQTPKLDVILVQNPPAVPLLLVAVLYSKLFATRLIIDWHNLGYSMLPPKLQAPANFYERTLAQYASGHLTVTKAMRTFLQKEFGISNSPISVLYDCPPSLFRMLSISQQYETLNKINWELPTSWKLSNEKINLWMERHGTTIRYREQRPALVVSSTSWTPDEDFGILLEACVLLEQRILKVHSNLRVLVVVTGKGPQKSMYQERISQLTLERVIINTVWLTPADYPRLLACADVGVSLHTSTSGLDLPMKVLDLFGCEVPVNAVRFACLHELIQDDTNGKIFDTANELADLLWHQLKDTHGPNHSWGDLHRYSKQLQGRRLWSENWKAHAQGLVEGDK